MFKRIMNRETLKHMLKPITGIAVAMAMIATVIVAPMASQHKVDAASAPVSINMIYYGWLTTAISQEIVNTDPAYLVANSPAGPWHGNANISQFTSAGIKYFEYIDGGYEGTIKTGIPNDLQSNLGYITAAANAGAYGIFVDEVSDGIYTQANYSYLLQLADKAHSLGLKIVFNTGAASWSDQLMNYADFVSSSETWSNTTLTACQTKWATRTWLLTYGVNDATTASNLTTGAWSKGIAIQYSCTSYSALPTWFDAYIAQLKTFSAPLVAPTTQTLTASAVTTTGAVLNGNMTNLGTAASVTVNFQWGTTTAYGNTTANQSLIANGNISAPITGLTPGTTYHYRTAAAGNGTAYGADQIITTNPLVAPTVSTVGATLVTTAGATINGTLSAIGTCAKVTVNFQWGLTTAYGNTTSAQTITAAGNFNAALSGLASGTTYHYRTIAVGDATVTGADQSFTTTTAPAPVPVTVPTNGNTTAKIANTPAASGGANEYNLYITVTTSTVTGVTVNMQVWCAASTTDFPTLLTVGSTVTGNLDHSLGYWRLLKATTTTPAPVPVIVPTSGNTTAKIANTPASSGGANEYNLYITITSSTVSGVTVNMQVWCAASTTDFPTLLTVGSTVTGNLDHSLGYWRLLKAQ